MSAVAALILAAGRGSRFGADAKLLADFRGKPLVRDVADQVIASRAAPVIIVLGHRQEEIAAALSGAAVRQHVNPRFAEGLSTSLQAGFEALPDETEAALVVLADMPQISTALMDRLIETWRQTRPPAVVPSFHGQRGNPVVLSRQLAGEVAALTGDMGAAPLLRRLSGVVELPVECDGILRDVDTPEALAALADQRRR
jgi:molybdenum cofactor cytidylyltransferase